MKNIWNKIGIGVIIIAIIGTLAFLIKLNIDAKDRAEALTRQVVDMKTLQDEVVRSKATYVSKEDMNKFAKDINLNLDPIRKDLESLGAEVQGLSKVLTRSRGYQGTNLGSSGTSPRDPSDPSPNIPVCQDGTPCEDPYGYWANAQTKSFFEPFGDDLEVPMGSATFKAWKEKPWDIDIRPREYHIATVLGQDENGRHYIHNKFQIEVDGERHDIPIEQAEFVEKLPEAEFRFDTHLNLGVFVGGRVSTSGDASSAEVAPTLGVSFFSYGETKVIPTWKFLEVGVNYGSQAGTLGVHVNPVDYNIGEALPLIDNLYLGPTIGLDIDGNVQAGAGIRVRL